MSLLLPRIRTRLARWTRRSALDRVFGRRWVQVLLFLLAFLVTWLASPRIAHAGWLVSLGG